MMPIIIKEYSDNYSKTCGSLWQYCRDEEGLKDNCVVIDFADSNTTDLLKFKEKIASQTRDNGTKNADIMVTFKYLSIFFSEHLKGD